jgi:hypothetical protein
MHDIYICVCVCVAIIQEFIQPILTTRAARKCWYSKSNCVEKLVKRIIRAGYTFLFKKKLFKIIQDSLSLSLSPYMGARRSLISAADGMVSVG